MIEAPLDDVLYVGQFIAVSVFEWLYFEGVIIQGWLGGGGGFDVCDVCVHLEEEGGGVWAGREGTGVNYHNWSIPRVSSSREWTGQGLSSSKQEHFFAPKSSSKRSFFLFKVTTDG